jgi:hypothetical protein
MTNIEFSDIDALQTFWQRRPSSTPQRTDPHGQAEWREQIVRWLVDAGMSESAIDRTMDAHTLALREPVRLFVWIEDASASASVVAIAENALTDAQRADCDALDSACFETRFVDDLAPEQFRGALWTLAWFSMDSSDGASLDQLITAALEEIEGEIDRNALRAALGTGGPATGTLNAPISRCHTLRLAM